MLKSNLKLDNSFSLIGKVTSHLKRNTSPSGIEHGQFWLEHRSKQYEAGLERVAWCKIPVQFSGNQLASKTQSITVGSNVLVQGFLTVHKTSSGIYQLVLHAEQIEFID